MINLLRSKGHHLERTLLGQRFGRLIVVARVHFPRELRWKCRCDCGGTIVTPGYRLEIGRTVSCGCRKHELNAELVERGTTHGACRTPEYLAWRCMIARCHQPGHVSYPRYGGRGISVCAEWRSDFPAFLASVGPKPSRKHSLERLKGDVGYQPGNCVWATATEQARNRSTTIRVVYRGETISLSEALERGGGRVKRTTALARLQRGMSVELAVEVAP